MNPSSERIQRARLGVAGLFVASVIVWAPWSAVAQDALEPGHVDFQNREIATLRVSLGPLTPTERADLAEKRLGELTRHDMRAAVVVVPYGDARNVFLGERLVVGITPGDIDASGGETVDEVAQEVAQNLREALAVWADQRRPEVIISGVVRVVIASLVAVILLLVLQWIRRRVLAKMSLRTERAIEKRRTTVFGHDLRGVAVRSVRAVLELASAMAALVIVYSWLTFALRQFPLTEPWGNGLAGFLGRTAAMVGIGLLRGIPDLLVVAVILFVTRFFARLATKLFDAVERGVVAVRGVHPDTADATRRIVITVIWVFGIAIAYPFIPGSSSDAFKGISVLVGIMISLGSSGVINQAMSGMVVVFSRALKMGEYVCIENYEGTVTEVGALSTKIRTKRNEEINVPNALLVSSITKNYSRLAETDGAIVFATAGIGYDVPWRTVHSLLVDAARRTPGVRSEPAPFVRQSALTSFCVDYSINAYLERADARLEVLSNLNANIQDAFNDAGIQIMTPAFESQPEQPVLSPRRSANSLDS